MTHDQSHRQHLHYRLTQEDYHALHACLSSRAAEEASRCVHSLIFASYLDKMTTCSHQELAVPVARFALNYYDNDPTYLILERRQSGLRTTAMVTEAECRALLAGENDWLLNRHDPLLLDFHDALNERMLLPQMLLSYHREIYTSNSLDLQVALDTGIRSSMEYMDFLDPQQLRQSTSNQEGQILMEVSYSSRIPDDVLCLLEENAPRRKLLPREYIPA